MNRAIKREAFRELLEQLLSNSPAEPPPGQTAWEGGMLVSRQEAKDIIQSLIPKHSRPKINEKTTPAKAPELDSPPPSFPDKRPKPDLPGGMRPPITPAEDARLSPSASLLRESLSNSFFTKEESECLALRCAHYEAAKSEEGIREYFISVDHLDHHQRYAAALAVSRAYPKERVKLSHFGPEEGEHAVIHFGAKSALRRQPRP